MITDEGRVYIKRYLAGWVPKIASSIAYGIGDKVENGADRKLEFELGRADIIITSYDFVEDRLVFKAALPDDLTGSVREVAIFSQEKNALSGDYDSQLLTTFDSETEEWTNPDTGNESAFSTTHTRIGFDSLRLAAGVSSTQSALLDGIGFDFSGNTSADRFTLAGNVGANVASIQVHFMTDTDNYYTVSFTPTAGYRFMSKPMSLATITGNPSWEEINMLMVSVTAGAGGAAAVDLDGLRLEDTDTPNPEYVMIAREVLDTPFQKEAGRSQAIEFAVNANIL